MNTVNNETTNFIWNGQNMVAEAGDNDIIQNTYTYDVTGVLLRNDTDWYLKNAHGDVVGMTDSRHNLIKEYRYDAFGNEIGKDANDTNPFRYCGEYYDSETENIYLRARYYNPADGRFVSEDPIKDGLNWYSYCAGNPVALIDPLGLFDYNTRLSYNPDVFNPDVKALQNELAWKGYLSKDDVDGYFGSKTLEAVNRYKSDAGLWNQGGDEGVVGLTTWQSLGLIYRTQQDIDAGVKIATIGAKQYFDVTKVINDILWETKFEFRTHEGDMLWFKAQVDHEAPWDIKRRIPWESTVGTTYPGSSNALVVFRGEFVTPEILGNITYGFLGTAAGFSQTVLLAGGDYAAGGIWGMIRRADSQEDKNNVKRGINWYWDSIEGPQPGPAPR